jgi:hypothetical protein
MTTQVLRGSAQGARAPPCIPRRAALRHITLAAGLLTLRVKTRADMYRTPSLLHAALEVNGTTHDPILAGHHELRQFPLFGEVSLETMEHSTDVTAASGPDRPRRAGSSASGLLTNPTSGRLMMWRAADRARSQVRSYGICGGQSGTGAVRFPCQF